MSTKYYRNPKILQFHHGLYIGLPNYVIERKYTLAIDYIKEKNKRGLNHKKSQH